MEPSYKMTIIIPVYNEIEGIDRIEQTFLSYLPKASKKSKVLFIDDGSLDGSFEKIKAICDKNSEFEYLKFKENRGLSTAIKAGFDYCNTELLAYIDADLQTTPEDFNVLLEHIDSNDAVIGFRAKRKDTLNKKIQSLIANKIRRSLINDGIKDTGCPLKIIKSDVAKSLPFFKGMHRFIPALIQLQGGKVKQLPVRHFERIAGNSKFNILNRSIGPLHDALAFRWMRKRYISYEIDQQNITSAEVNAG